MSDDSRKIGDIPVYAMHIIGYVLVVLVTFVLIRTLIKPDLRQVEVKLVDDEH